MSRNMTTKQKRTALIGAGMVTFLLIITILLLPLHIWSSFAATDSDLSATATAAAFNANSNDPFAQFCAAFYRVNLTTLGSGPLDKYNECLALGPAFQSYLQSRSITYGATSTGTPGVTPTTVGQGTTPTDTVGVTPTTVGTGATPTNTSTAHTLCGCVPVSTPTTVNTGVTPTTVSTGVTPTTVSTGVTPTATSSGTVWPTSSLVALEIPAEASKTGNAVSAADAAQVENNLTSYLQQQLTSAGTPTETVGTPTETVGTPTETVGTPTETVGTPTETVGTPTGTVQAASQQTGGQQNSMQAALNNWTSDPLLKLALVTYTSGGTAGQGEFADATDGHPSFTDLSTYIMNDPNEVSHIQLDLARSVQSSTYKPSGVDCSFTPTVPIVQSYQSCLGTDTLFDVLYSERYSGTNTTVLFNSVASILENEFTNEVNSYLQANASTAGGQEVKAQKAYAYIASITDHEMKVTIMDHMFSEVVKDEQMTLCPLTGSPTVGATATSVSTLPTVGATNTNVGQTPGATDTSVGQTPEATATSGSQTPVVTVAPCVLPSVTSVPQPTSTVGATGTSVSQTPVATATACIGEIPQSQTPGVSGTPCDAPVSGAQTPEPGATPCVTPSSVSRIGGKARA